MTDRAAIDDFVGALFAGQPPETWLSAWSPGACRWAADVAGIATAIAELAPEGDTYVCPSTQRERGSPFERAQSARSATVGALWLDFDILGPGHAQTRLPPSLEVALHFITSTAPIAPSIVVHSGGGLQPWWLLDHQVDVELATTMIEGLKTFWRAKADEHGWVVDAVFDLARVMRVPGTYNCKIEPRRPVVAIEAAYDLRYSIEDITSAFPPPAQEPHRARIPLTAPTTTEGPFDELPGNAFNRQRRCGDVLADLGWTLVGRTAKGDKWRHPNASYPHSAVVYDDNDRCQIFTSSFLPVIDPDNKDEFDAYGLYARLAHQGDFARAREALEAAGYGSRRQAPAQLNGKTPHTDVPETAAGSLFDDKGRFVVTNAGRRIRDTDHIVVGADGRLYWYDHGVYVPDGDQRVREQLRQLLGKMWKRAHQDEVLAWLRAGPVFITGDPNRGYLNVANGLLMLGSLELRPHTPEEASAIQLKAAWDPTATCPTIVRFMGEVLPEIPPDFLFEIIGYTLYPANTFAKAVMALGAGANGKSTFLGMLRSLLGQGNYSSVPLQQLAENQFAGAELFGKLANICGDIDARAVKRTDLFKQITGGDPIRAERKYAHGFTFTAFATPWFSANEAPITSDQTEAWFRRWIVLPFNASFDGAQADPFLEEKLTTSNELNGLLVEAVHGLRRLMERGHFDTPTTVTAAGGQYRDRLDTVRGFVDEECVVADDGWIAKADIYRHYRTWCGEGGRMALSAATFADRLARDFALTPTKVRGERRWSGIRRRASQDFL